MKQSRKRRINWSRLLNGVPAGDYIFQDVPYEEQIGQAAALLREAEIILIGGGAGVSAAAGLSYSGERFTGNFGEFIEKYGSRYMTVSRRVLEAVRRGCTSEKNAAIS